MEKWPEDYECDGQLSLFPVDFSKCMNPPEPKKEDLRMKKYRVSRMIDGHLHTSCIKCKDKETAVKTIQTQDRAMFKCNSWELDSCEEEVEK